MALATRADVETALGRELTDGESERVDSLLEEATDLVTGYLHPCPIPEPTPKAISRVIATMVASALSRLETAEGLPDNATQVGAGPFNITFGQDGATSSPWLTASLKLRLAPFVCGSSRMVSQEMASERR